MSLTVLSHTVMSLTCLIPAVLIHESLRPVSRTMICSRTVCGPFFYDILIL